MTAPFPSTATVGSPTARGGYWHPFANMATARRDELVLVEGHGSEVLDADGRRYLDATASLWYCNVGYGRDEIVAAVEAQMRALPAYSTFGSYANAPALELADRLAALAPFEDAAVFLTSGGSDAVETVGKLVRAYWTALGQPQRQIVIARDRAYHGMHTLGTSLAGIPANHAVYGDMVPTVAHIAHDSAAALEAEIERLGSDSVAAFIAEPVIGAGGVIPPPDGYWPAVAEVCRAHGILLVSDEVICGFGRLGEWWGCQRYGVVPDLVTFAKGVTSGYMPLGGVLASPRVQEPFFTGEGTWFRHGYTYSGHAAAAAAALANLDVVEGEELLAYAGTIEPRLAETLARLGEHALVGAVRAEGLVGAVELAPDVLAADPGLLDRVVLGAREQHVLTRALGGTALQISPPLIVTPEQVEALGERLWATLEHVEMNA